MQTILKSTKRQVVIDIEKPFVIIGEKINPTGRKKLAAALENRDYDYIRDLAVRQVAAGADVLDINVGAPGIDEIAVLSEVARILAEQVEAPLCLDSANREALSAALAVLPDRADEILLARATGMAPREVELALDELEWQRWVTSDARGYSFIARIVREIVKRDMLTPGQRRRIEEAVKEH